jgi:uncharacterized protein DUF4395
MTTTPDRDTTVNEGLEDLPVLRHRLEVQSFLNQSCETLHDLKNWWRFTPTLNWSITLVGILLRSPEILLAQAALMGIGIFTPSHPLDGIYNLGVRRLTGTPPLPRSGQRRKIVFFLGAALLIILAGLFAAGYDTAGYIQGAIMTFLGGLLMVFNLCVVSETLAKIFGKPTT